MNLLSLPAGCPNGMQTMQSNPQYSRDTCIRTTDSDEMRWIRKVREPSLSPNFCSRWLASISLFAVIFVNNLCMLDNLLLTQLNCIETDTKLFRSKNCRLIITQTDGEYLCR